METIIKVRDVSLSFKDKEVLKKLNFDVQKGEIFGFLGPSGAGKTTTMKLLTGQLVANQGDIMIFDFKNKINKEQLSNKIGILTDNSGLYENMSVYENLKLFADLNQLDIKRIDEVLKEVGLLENKFIKGKNLSKGMKQRLLFARAILHKPSLLFLDEPTSSLDPTTSEIVRELIRDLNRNGTTVFLTTHNMEEADTLCDRVAFLNQGSISVIGKPNELKVKYGSNKIEIVTKNQKKITCEKNRQSIMLLLPTLDDEIDTIHSIEPNLSEIFRTVTGGTCI